MPVLAHHGTEDPMFAFAEERAGEVKARFVPVPGNLRGSFVDADPAVSAVVDFLTG